MMPAIPFFWTLEYAPALLNGLPLPVEGNPTLLVRRDVVRALAEPEAPLWEHGADPFSREADTAFGGRLNDYDGEIAFDPPLTQVLQRHLDLVSSFGFRQDARFQFAFGYPSALPERWGFPGSLTMPTAWNTEERSTSLVVYLFPPDGGWCQRAVVRQPEVNKRVAVHRPEREGHHFDLDDMSGRFAYPTSAGSLQMELEVNGTITRRTIDVDLPISDETGGRLHEITPANGWAEPGWEGRIYRQVDWALDWPFVQFGAALELDLGTEMGQSVHWRLADHEGRTTPWVRYLVPPVAEILPLNPMQEPPGENEEMPVFERDTMAEFLCPGWDAEGSIVRFDWNFGDGTALSLPGPAGAAVAHTYVTEANRVVRLRIFDNDGLAHETTLPIQIQEADARLPALVGKNGIITLLRSLPAGVQVVHWQVPDGAEGGQKGHLWSGARDPCLWQLRDGSLVAIVREGVNGPYTRWLSVDGGSTWQ